MPPPTNENYLTKKYTDRVVQVTAETAVTGVLTFLPGAAMAGMARVAGVQDLRGAAEQLEQEPVFCVETGEGAWGDGRSGWVGGGLSGEGVCGLWVGWVGGGVSGGGGGERGQATYSVEEERQTEVSVVGERHERPGAWRSRV
jgi:uncharacterized membrane protein YgcG